MRELEKIMSVKLTENGDLAYSTTGNEMNDILFMSQYYRSHIDELPDISEFPRAKIFAMMMRDPRLGFGEREIGRKLLASVKATEEEMVFCGRYDDLLDAYPEYVIEEAKKGNALAKKWLPRLTSSTNARNKAKTIIKKCGLTEKEYRSICRVDTVESKLTEKRYAEINYASVPSLAMMKYMMAFRRNDEEHFSAYLENLKKGETKINMSVANCYDVYKRCVSNKWGDIHIDENAEVLFNNLTKVNLGSILPIIDTSGSMYDMHDSDGKSKAIGHYVAVNSTYLPNKVLTFSMRPQLIDLGDTYKSAMDMMYAYNEIGNTDFGKVMDLLSNLHDDYPDYLLVLTDMEFDEGSNTSKEETMRIFRERGIPTKIIWWNFNARNKTCPEQDDSGNIFISGYNPNLLSLLELGFNQEAFVNKLLDEYENAYLAFKN